MFKNTHHLLQWTVILSILIFICAVSCQKDIKVPIFNSIELDSIKFNIPDGFELEDIFSPSNSNQGSWVSITEGPNNQFFTCDQYGDIYTFQMPAVGETLDSLSLDTLTMNIGWAQGLLWAYNSLYVVVVKGVDENKPDDPSSGVYRITDTNDDGKLDKMVNILTLDGTGEHGPHTLRVGSDNSLYLLAGNFNTVPEHFKSRLPKNWGEDNLFEPYLDARGHAVDLKAPGGWLAKTDPEGSEWEIIGAGMRNPFSFGINKDDEIFAYDADMEWDFGMPWYRPTRILHITSGAEFGWRTGSGKWPVFYPDNLPPVENMSQGSPTAVIMGHDLNFPSKYKNGLFACDWSFGTMYYVDIQEDGSSYTGQKEEFLSGVPLPISNAIAGSDGNLYFLTGGRRLKSHLYRLRYTGPLENDTEDLASNTDSEELRELRKSLEQYHYANKEEGIEPAWEHLAHSDKHIQYAARMVLEHQKKSLWQERIFEESNPEKVIHGALAYTRSDGSFDPRIVETLNALTWDELNDNQKIALLRVYELLLIRNDLKSSPLDAEGKTNGPQKQMIADRLVPLFPAKNPMLNRTLSQLLIYLEAPGSIEKCLQVLNDINNDNRSQAEILDTSVLSRSEQYGPQIAAMIENMPPTEAIHYVTLLSHAKSGWTKKSRTDYFLWFYEALKGKGGESYKPFLDNIRAKALSNVPEEDKEHFENMSGFYSPMRDMASLAQPIGPGQEYNLYDLGRVVLWGDDKLNNYSGNIQKGERAYEAGLCKSCHRMKGEGGGSGPDLTNLHTRFDKGDIAKSLLSPNEEISDQYAFHLFKLKNGESLTGRIVNETPDSIEFYQSPFDITQTRMMSSEDIESKELSPISSMPAKLLDRLNEEEIVDLFVYLMSGADPDHEYYNGPS